MNSDFGLSFYLFSNDLLGIYNFILYGRIPLIWGFVASSGFKDD